MIPKSKNNNNNFYKLNNIIYDKLKPNPKQKYISRKNSNKNNALYNYNNSIEVDSKLFEKLQKLNKVSIQNKPLSSERIKKKSSEIKKEILLNLFSIKNSKNNMNKKDNYILYNQMELLNYNNDLFNYELNGSNDKNFSNQNIINNIVNENLFLDENENFNNTDGNNDFNIINNYNIQKFKIFNQENLNCFEPNINQINNRNNNLNINISESSNKYDLKVMKNLTKLKNMNINAIEENMDLNNELDKVRNRKL